MKTDKTLSLIALATSGLLFAASANATKAAPAKTADKAAADASQCSGPNGCDGKTSDYKCEGANSCKGTSACRTKAHKCAGHNACKGQGWIKTKDKAACDKAKKA